MGKIRRYLGEIGNIKVGTTQVLKVRRGTTLIWEFINILDFTPSFDNQITSNNYTTQNFTCAGDGDAYFTMVSASDYIDVEYYINDSYVGYLYATGSGYVSSRTIAFSDGDTIKFRLTINGTVSLELKDTDDNGEIVWTGSYESA